MSRDLKNEYVAMLDQEIPDLWSRIEPKLTEKTGKSRMSQTAGMQEAGTQTTDAQINQTQITQMQEAGTQITGGQTVRRKKSELASKFMTSSPAEPASTLLLSGSISNSMPPFSADSPFAASSADT